MGAHNYVSIMKRSDLERNLARESTLMNFAPPIYGGKIGSMLDV